MVLPIAENAVHGNVEFPAISHPSYQSVLAHRSATSDGLYFAAWRAYSSAGVSSSTYPPPFLSNVTMAAIASGQASKTQLEHGQQRAPINTSSDR